LYQTGNVAAVLTYKNNIFQNSRTGGSGVQYCYGTNYTGPIVTMDYNFYSAPSESSFANINGAISSIVFRSSADDYGGTNSKFTTSSISFNNNGSGALAAESDYLIVGRGANLSAIANCGEDITGSTTTRASSAGIKGCYEYNCTSNYAGTYYVGTGGTWTTLTNALAALN